MPFHNAKVGVNNNPLIISPFVQNFENSVRVPPPPSSSFLIAEDGSYLITENGYNFITG